MSEMAVYAIAAVRGIIHGLLFVYFWNEKKWLGMAAVAALVLLEVVK